MKTLQEICEELKVNIHTLRYHLTKNEQDYNDGLYDIHLKEFIELQLVFRNGMFRKLYGIDNDYVFKEQYINYISWIKLNKKIKRNSSLRWNESSIECWKNKGQCTNCRNHSICMKSRDEPPYPMISIVEKLIKEIGEPELFYKT